MSVMYGHADLLDVPWMGDRAQDMQNFLNCWDSVNDNMSEGLADKVKRDLLYRRVQASKMLSEDLAHFRREKAKGETAENYA